MLTVANAYDDAPQRHDTAFGASSERDAGPQAGGVAPDLVVTGQKSAYKLDADLGVAEILGLRFPSEAEVRHAAVVLQGVSRDSPLRSVIEVSPGSIRFRRTVPPDHDDDDAGGQKGSGRQAITGWTLKSRRQMTRSFAAIDYAPMFDGGGLAAMVTLTYPADWLTVAPTRQAVQRHFRMLERRFARAWDGPLVALWKLEYQHRGAPHYHLLMRRPAGTAGRLREVRQAAEMLAWEASGRRGRRPGRRRSVGDGLQFTQWLAAVWADILGQPARVHVDIKRGLDCRDPRRASIYFSKHGLVKGDKEYQNRPPKEWLDVGIGPGRYWGYVGLRQLIAVAQVDGGKDYQLAKRTMRRWAARTRVWDDQARRYRYVKAMRTVAKPGESRPGRKVRRPVNRLAGASGSLCLNDAPSMAADLARLIALTTDYDQAVNARRQVAGPMTGVREQAFLCDTCGCVHPLREHRRCRKRARLVVAVR